MYQHIPHPCLIFFVFAFSFGCVEHGILVPQPGIELAPHALAAVLTTRPPGSPSASFLNVDFWLPVSVFIFA